MARLPDDPEGFIRRNTALETPAMVPEFKLWLASEYVPIWQATEAWLEEQNVDPPYWAFCWPGGQAIARYLLDHADLVQGKQVIDFAAGSGVSSMAAAKAGAASANRAGVMRCGEPVISKTLSPDRPSCPGATTMSKRSVAQRGSWVWTTKVRPPLIPLARTDSGRVARPVAIHRSGQGGSRALDDGSSIAGVFNADGRRSNRGRQRTRFTAMSAGVVSRGMFTVLEIAPEMKGWAAAIIFT